MDQTQAWITALRHPLRRELLCLIAESSEAVSPKQLASTQRAPLSNVSYHIRVLVDTHAIKLDSTRSARGSVEHFYRVARHLWDTPWVIESLGLIEPTPKGSGGAEI